MESKKEEAIKAKEYAEKRFAAKDYAGAKNFALKAQTLFPDLDGICQMLATFDIYAVSDTRINGEVDFYSVLGLKHSAERSMIKKQYKKLAVLLHPDKNKTVGAEGAFKLISEAWTLLSDAAKRASYDLRRNGNQSSVLDECTNSSLPPSFWTVCTSCQVQYEYLRKYVNKRLSCKNCRSTFIAAEQGTAPVDGSYPISWSSYTTDNRHGSHGYNGIAYCTASGIHIPGKAVAGYHAVHGSEYASSVSLQWGAPGASTGYADPTGYTTGYVGKQGKQVKATTSLMNSMVVEMRTNGSIKTTRPYKKRMVEFGIAISANGNHVGRRVIAEGVNVTGSSTAVLKFSGSAEPSSRQHPVLSTLDARSILIKKARSRIIEKLNGMKAASAAVSEKSKVRSAVDRVVGKFGVTSRKMNLAGSDVEPQRIGPINLVVPDPDFHDFDKDRTEECFKPKQIWALYDEEDGMPRLYCLIREVISINPLKMHISYLSSKSDSEFGLVNWISSGFTKSCGHFRVLSSDVVEQVNMFSHLLSRDKAGRGGCIRIYPRSGDIWAVYRNWSPDWNRSTSYEVRHQYEMVEVVEDYSEELGVSVAPLIKLDGFKTVYRRKAEEDAVRWIPRREMLRFSHQVPCSLLNEEKDLPEGCWELDPAATPDELLQVTQEAMVEEESGEAIT